MSSARVPPEPAFPDEYTTATRAWLDARFAGCDEHGVYQPHQPIYGFEHSRELGLLVDYSRLYRVLRVLSRISFTTLLEVGAAEGMLAHLARQLFDAEIETCDLSAAVCARAREIFAPLRATPADVHSLPFADDELDVVVCMETLEHVSDPRLAVSELVRVARRAAVITVPHQSLAEVERERIADVPHRHLHAFAPGDIDDWADGHRAVVTRMLCPWLRAPFVLVEARPLSATATSAAGRLLRTLYQAARPMLRRALGPRAAGALMRLDDPLVRLSRRFDGMLVAILKDPACWLEAPRRAVSPLDVLSLSVPPHRIAVSPDATPPV